MVIDYLQISAMLAVLIPSGAKALECIEHKFQ
jgi:hypothetical protein